jgi:hypothetical protein
MNKTLKSYIWWTYPRSSFHYDVMVTLILLFIFVTPRLWDYGDKPPRNVGAAPQMQVEGDGGNGLIVTVPAEAVRGMDGSPLQPGAAEKTARKALKKALEPVTGDEFFLTRWEALYNARGEITGWRAWVHR